MRFKSDLPEFHDEVRSLLLQLGRNDLAGQLGSLQIVYRCPCTNYGCASFKVAGSSSPDGFEGPQPKRSTFTPSVNLNASKGSVTIITDQLGRITAFEVLQRPDVRRKLLRL